MTYDACYCDYDPPAFCNVEPRKARKAHKCYECRGPIEAGERYEYTRGKWEGDIYTFKVCALCLELRAWATISVPCFCWAYGDLHENIREMVEEVRSDVPAGFVFEWGRRIIKIERKRYAQHWPRQFRRRQPPRSASEIVAESRL